MIADPDMLRARAALLGLPLDIDDRDTREPGRMTVLPVPAPSPVTAGVLDPGNADYVLQTLRTAVDRCLAGAFHALVTGPVQKSVLDRADAGFTGHTGSLRVALATTHVPLSDVPGLITRERIDRKLRTLTDGLRSVFGIERPRIAVAGLNPHAGEAGHLGREEIDVLEPVCRQWREDGAPIEGPLPADTIFQRGDAVDAILAMYHDQGLPVLKYVGFGAAVNVTLGLPFLRTSVDHGTALTIAGTGAADSGSLMAALDLAART